MSLINLPDFTRRRDALRHLSRARAEAGLSNFPTIEEVRDYASKSGLREADAHIYLMREGERILETRKEHEQTISSYESEFEEDPSLGD